MTIALRIRALRTERGLTQEQVARRADLSLNAYNRIEREVIADPHSSSVEKIARALEVPVSVLYGEELLLAGKAEARQEAGNLQEPESIVLSYLERATEAGVTAQFVAYVEDFFASGGQQRTGIMQQDQQGTPQGTPQGQQATEHDPR